MCPPILTIALRTISFLSLTSIQKPYTIVYLFVLVFAMANPSFAAIVSNAASNPASDAAGNAASNSAGGAASGATSNTATGATSNAPATPRPPPVKLSLVPPILVQMQLIQILLVPLTQVQVIHLIHLVLIQALLVPIQVISRPVQRQILTQVPALDLMIISILRMLLPKPHPPQMRQIPKPQRQTLKLNNLEPIPTLIPMLIPILTQQMMHR